MHDASDMELLRDYGCHDSESAFAEVVQRHIGLVYSAAFRHTENAAHAEEITQAVFIILARKAASLRPGTVLEGWLYETTRLTALSFLRGERRRQFREQEAYMQSTSQESTGDALWNKLSPLLDEAVSRLGKKDRDALLLRFFKDKSVRDVAATMQVNEAAAQRRILRALEKLRKFFTKRGVSSTTAIIAGTISANSVQAAPVALAKSVTVVAIAKGAAASGSTLTLIQGALKIMAWTKAKTAVAVGLAAVLGMSTAVVVVKVVCFPAIKDAYFQPDYRYFQNLPRGLFVLRPTHFTTPTNGLDYSAEDGSPSGEHVTLFMGRNRSFEQLIFKAYGGDRPYAVFPAETPKGNFDYLCTILDNRAGEHLQAAIKQKLGYVASWKQHDTDVYLLKVKKPDSPRLRASNPASKSLIRENAQSQIEFHNRYLGDLTYQIESLANVPVRNETGLADPFDFILDCSKEDLVSQDWDAVSRALDRLGLELVPTYMPIGMLVVDKVK